MILHETTIDLQHEQRFSDKLQFLWGVELVKLPELSRADFVIIRGDKVTGFIEFKQRTFDRSKYGTALLSLDKWLYLNVLSDSTRLPVYLFIGYSDCDTFIQISNTIPVEAALREGKPVVLIPVNNFENL